MERGLLGSKLLLPKKLQPLGLCYMANLLHIPQFEFCNKRKSFESENLLCMHSYLQIQLCHQPIFQLTFHDSQCKDLIWVYIVHSINQLIGAPIGFSVQTYVYKGVVPIEVYVHQELQKRDQPQTLGLSEQYSLHYQAHPQVTHLYPLT